MTTKYTPGPWAADRQRVLVPRTDGKPQLAIAHAHGITAHFDDEAEANALLMAAAPELLSACKLVIARMAAERTEDAVQLSAETYDALTAAIARAEGRKPSDDSGDTGTGVTGVFA